ncbi:MAG: tRNA pseudouridine(38-40) synthase TruA [Desulfobacteraceae bacterium]|jgi:tRNA pseudouridine38-40 synthase
MEKKVNIRMVLQYDGSHYHGWQRQKEAPTIQGVLEDRLQMMTGERVKLIASGRTDAGVHALYQVCHFITHTKIDPPSISRGLNGLIPWDIFIKKAEYVPLDFHARYSAKSKTYEYRILNRKEPDLFLRLYTWHVPMKLDTEEMEKCISALRGKHDFSSFKSTGSGNTNPVREMMRAELHVPEEGVLRFVFEADGFLRHMVRNIVGTVVDAGRGRMDFGEFMELFKAKDRQMAGLKAPPHGLFLTMVQY